MCRIQVQIEAADDELLDASDNIRELIDSDGELGVTLREVLLAVDDAITDVFVEARA